MAENTDFSFQNSIPGDGVIGLASPKDRLAAFIVDLLILMPIVQLLQSPMKRWIFESLVFGEVEQERFFNGAKFLIFLILFVTYFSVMTWKWGQTFGKKLFFLKVISYQGKLGLVSALTRSLSKFFQILTLGLPFFAILSHSLRRPIHDRIGDTLVISLKSPVGYPSLKERFRARLGVIGLVVVVIFSLVTYSLLSLNPLDGDSFARIQCNKKLHSEKLPLVASMELFLIGEVNGACVERQAKKAIWNKEDGALASLALAFAYKDDNTLSKKYFEQVCDKEEFGFACHFSQWVQSDLKSNEVKDLIPEGFNFDDEMTSFYASCFASNLNLRGAYKEAQEVLFRANPSKNLTHFNARLAIHALLGQNKLEQAYWVQKTHGLSNIALPVFLETTPLKLSVVSKKKIIEKFYPQIISQGRGIASQVEVPEDVQVIYKKIDGDL